VIEYPFLLAFPVAMAFAAANDLFTMKIPNKISLVLIVSFLAAALLTGMARDVFLTHVAIGAAVLVATFALFSLKMLGGGDAKLMAAGALWMGMDNIVFYLAYVTIFGGILAVAILAYRRLVPVASLALPGWAMRLHQDGSGIPYGIAIAASALLVYPQTVWFQAFQA
jgi:prepilin peptidase CpaA